MNKVNLEELLKSSGYYITGGHFRLVSGKHSDAYVQARLALMLPEVCDSFCSIAIELIRELKPTSVAGFTVGGLLLAEAISKNLRIPLIIGRKFHQGTEWVNNKLLKPGERILLVDDVLTTASQLKLAIPNLEETEIDGVIGILIAVNRSETIPELVFRGEKLPIFSCVKIPLTTYDPSVCPSCKVGIPPTDLSNPEKDFISVLLSQPQDKSDFILKGYEKVYEMQEETALIEEIRAWKPWLPVLMAGLPMARMEEDSRLIRFVTLLSVIAKEYNIKPRVLSDIVGQLVSLSSIRVESRPIGCSILIGDFNAIERMLESRARVKLPIVVSCDRLANMVPHFDAFLETNYVLVLNSEGNTVGFRKLIYTRRKSYMEGIELLRFVTEQTNSIGFALKRGRCSISVYSSGRLEAMGELSEKTGLWEFFRPMERIDEISKIISGISNLLVTIIEVARELVAKGYGALFIVGNTIGLNHTQPKIEIEPQLISEISIEDIVELAKLDGAVIIDREGKLIRATVIIQNREEESYTPLLGGMHGGSRKETARRTSIECPDCAAIYVSQNGAIEIYVRGDSWPISEAISGLSRR